MEYRFQAAIVPANPHKGCKLVQYINATVPLAERTNAKAAEMGRDMFILCVETLQFVEFPQRYYSCVGNDT